MATALIQPLAWEPPYVAGEGLEKTKKKGKLFFFQGLPLWRNGISGVLGVLACEFTPRSLAQWVKDPALP